MNVQDTERATPARLKTAASGFPPAQGRQAAPAKREAPSRRPPFVDLVKARNGAAAIGQEALGFLTYRNSFLAIVVAPFFLVFVYLMFLASDQYVAQARFAVRTLPSEMAADSKNQGGGASLSQGSLPSLASQDAYIIASYIRSAAIIDDLPPELKLGDIYRRPGSDFLARLKANATREELADYWRGKVSAYVDSLSGTVTIDVLAFRAEDAQQLAQAIVAGSEKLANLLSERARRDAMARAEQEVRRTEAMVRAALADMRAYRDSEGFLDPGAQATSTSALLQQAMAEKIQLQNEYFVASNAMSPSAPITNNLRARLDAVDLQINRLKEQLTSKSPETKAITASLVRFEELELKRIFSEKLYMMAQSMMERARAKAEQQRIYVAVFVPPALPEEAQFPKRGGLLFQIGLALAVIWGIVALIAATIKDHTY